MITIPKGTREAKCPRGCGVTVYWVEKKHAGGRGTVRIPVSCDGLGESAPDSWTEGQGINHLQECTE